MALFIKRKPGQRVRLELPGGAGHVWLTLMYQRGNMTLAIDGPTAVRVHREELLPEAENYDNDQGRKSRAEEKGRIALTSGAGKCLSAIRLVNSSNQKEEPADGSSVEVQESGAKQGTSQAGSGRPQ